MYECKSILLTDIVQLTVKLPTLNHILMYRRLLPLIFIWCALHQNAFAQAGSYDLSIQVLPNPFTTSFTIQHRESQPVNMRLLNIFGSLILSIQDIMPRDTIIPPEGLPIGIYLLEITYGQKRTVKRLVKV